MFLDHNGSEGGIQGMGLSVGFPLCDYQGKVGEELSSFTEPV